MAPFLAVSLVTFDAAQELHRDPKAYAPEAMMCAAAYLTGPFCEPTNIANPVLHQQYASSLFC